MRRSSLSFLVSHRHGPGTNDPGTGGIDPWRTCGSGSRGSKAGAGGLGPLCRRRCALIVTAGLAASRWRPTLRYGPRPKARAVRQIFSIPVPGSFSDNTWQGAGLSGQWRRDRTFDSQIMSLMLFQLSYPWCRRRDSNPQPPDPNPALFQLSYIRDPNPRSGAVYRAAKPPARAETKAPTVVLASVFVTGSAPIAPATGCRKRHRRGDLRLLSTVAIRQRRVRCQRASARVRM